MKRVLVVTKNEYLAQKIALTLRGTCEVMRNADESFDVCFLDLDSTADAEIPNTVGRVVTMGTHGADITLPCSFDSIISAVEQRYDRPRLEFSSGQAFVDGRAVRLTAVESSLLGCLIAARGAFVSRDALLSEVWQGEADGGVLNVYIHYLREKLEQGEKIIISSRGEGYKIDERFLYAENN